MSKKLTVTATGDSLFVAKFPSYYDSQKTKLQNFINFHQLKITNLETNLSDFGHFGNAYSGGTWINTRKEYFDHLCYDISRRLKSRLNLVEDLIVFSADGVVMVTTGYVHKLGGLT